MQGLSGTVAAKKILLSRFKRFVRRGIEQHQQGSRRSGALSLTRKFGQPQAVNRRCVGRPCRAQRPPQLMHHPCLKGKRCRTAQRVGILQLIGKHRRIIDVEDTLIFAGGTRIPDVLDGLARAVYAPDSL